MVFFVSFSPTLGGWCILLVYFRTIFWCFLYIYILSYLLKKKKKKKNISCYNRWEILMSWNFVISGTDGWYLFLGLGN